MNQKIQLPLILKEEKNYWVVIKPSGWFVHPPSDLRALKQFSENIMTSWFWKNLKIKAYPIHRLDFSTEGLMIWAKDSASAAALNELHFDQRLQKTYHAVVRGFTLDSGLIDIPLLSDAAPEPVSAVTEYQTLKRLELPVQVHPAHPTSRYSLVEVKLRTGRWHQIRRHFDRIAHPLIGDQEHGDSHHNRYYRDHLKIPGLLLKAERLNFQCPFSGETQSFQTPMTDRWQKIYRLFQHL